MELSIMFLKAAEHVTDMEFRTSTEKILLNLDGTEKKWIPTNRWYCRKNDQDRSCSVLNDTGYAPSHWYPLHPYAGDGNRISLVDLKRGQYTRCFCTSNSRVGWASVFLLAHQFAPIPRGQTMKLFAHPTWLGRFGKNTAFYYYNQLNINVFLKTNEPRKIKYLISDDDKIGMS